MELEFTPIEKIAGTFVIAIFVLLLTTVVLIGRGKDWFATYITFYTTFKESYNLAENSAVKLYKTDIGKVKKITLEADKVRIRLAILEKYRSRVRRDTVAVVESPTFIGSEYISIIPGSSTAELLPEDGEIKSRAKKSIADIMDEFQIEKTAKMFVEAIQKLSQFVESLQDPNAPLLSALNNINTITTHINQISGGIQRGEGSIGQLLKSTAFSDSLQDRLDEIGVILAHIEKASAKTPTVVERAQSTGDELVRAMATIQQILSDIQKAVNAVNVILDNARQGSFDLPQITQSTKDGIQEIRDGVDNIDKVVQSLQKNFLIRSNLPPQPVIQGTDAAVRR